ncbi:syntaxin-71-like [Tripterygium wilfordii]|uniref:Syntaxin-71-like n=1 Tax=Tripterygium wilfordii TaxID=458696 RepID=A0A7J7CUD7_TRIWF|nr:syntaxin-71-like [Tripterygium wilfordii]
MTVIDILTRVDTICKKYDKYDTVKQKDSNVSGEDAFARLYAAVEADIEAVLQVPIRSPSVSHFLFHLLDLVGTSGIYPQIQSILSAEGRVTSNEKNRASAVALNAEIRRVKARLLEEVPKLQRLSLKKVKGLSSEEFAARNDLVLALPDRIQAIPDGTTAAPKKCGGWTSSAPRAEIKFDSDGHFDDEYFQHSESSSQFRQEHEMRKIK